MTKISAGPGWYADESDETMERYWNGSMWSDQRRSAVGAPRPVPTAAPRPADDQLTALIRRATEAAESTAASVRALLVITVVVLVVVIAGVVISVALN